MRMVGSEFMVVGYDPAAAAAAADWNRKLKLVFNAALDLIRDPAHWCQFRMTTGAAPPWMKPWVRLNWFYNKAAQLLRYAAFCSVGALLEAARLFGTGDGPVRQIRMHLDHAAGRYVCGGIMTYNDCHEHHEVIALWETVGREKGWL